MLFFEVLWLNMALSGGAGEEADLPQCGMNKKKQLASGGPAPGEMER